MDINESNSDWYAFSSKVVPHNIFPSFKKLDPLLSVVIHIEQHLKQNKIYNTIEICLRSFYFI